jgi:hypothetical protein
MSYLDDTEHKIEELMARFSKLVSPEVAEIIQNLVRNIVDEKLIIYTWEHEG